MKIPSIQQIREADAYTIAHEPIASIDLMERASRVCFEKIIQLFDNTYTFIIICGMGNNGGDGLAVARMLLEMGYDCQIYLVRHADAYSNDCRINFFRLQQIAPEKIKEVKITEEIPSLKADVIVDAVLGSGLNKTISDSLLCNLFKQINLSSAFVFAIDMPSGLFAEKAMTQDMISVQADYVFSFQFPKLAFFFPENYIYVGEWEVGDIGLSDEFIRGMDTSYYYIEEKDIESLKKHRSKFSHKGQFGHALLIAGSKGMMGAAVLGTKACLRSGAGIIEVHVPGIGYQIVQTCVNEALCSSDPNENHFTHLPVEKLANINAMAIGPGLGMHPETIEGLKFLLENLHQAVVFDADAINILAENKTILEYLPQYCIFTPHLKEFERLIGVSANSFESLTLQREFSNKYQCIVILKGAHSRISLPDGRIYFNSTGNPGMAGGGSGDVLTGIILGLLAQHYTPVEAALAGVYIHGKAADLALENQSYQSLTASDIIDYLSKV